MSECILIRKKQRVKKRQIEEREHSYIEAHAMEELFFFFMKRDNFIIQLFTIHFFFMQII